MQMSKNVNNDVSMNPPICNQANVHCYVDFQGRNIFIMYHVLQFLKSSFTKCQQFENRNWDLKIIH